MSELYSTTDLVDNLNYLEETKKQIRSAIVSKGQEVSETDSFRSYAAKIENIQTSSGANVNAYIFNSSDEMNAFTTPVAGDLAIVYYNNTSGVNRSGVYSYITLPDKVILPSPVTSIRDGNLTISDAANCLGFNINPDFAEFYFRKTKTNTIALGYVSSDGRTYTYIGSNNTSYDRKEFYNETAVNVRSNDTIQQHFLVLNKDINFSGLYQYNNGWKEAPTKLIANITNVYNNFNYFTNKEQVGTYTGNITNINTLISEINNIQPIISGVDVSNITDASYMFFRHKDYLPLVLNFNNLQITSDMFYASTIKEAPRFDASNVINSRRMFAYCREMERLPDLYMPKTEDVSYMFLNCNNLTKINSLNFSGAINASYLFNGCTALEKVANIQFNNVDSVAFMFSNCNNLITVPNFNTSNATSAACMFSNCNNLTSVPNYDFRKIKSITAIFNGCKSLTSVPNFNTSNVTNMSDAFYNCINLTSVPNFNTSNVTNMGYTLYNCTNLTSVPNFNTSNVTNMSCLLAHCNITSIPNFNTTKVTYLGALAANCANLITVPQLNTSNVTSLQRAFAGCNKLSNASIQNIINMCLNSNITDPDLMNLNVNVTLSPFNETNITSSRYSNRLSELSAAGWSY